MPLLGTAFWKNIAHLLRRGRAKSHFTPKATISQPEQPRLEAKKWHWVPRKSGFGMKLFSLVTFELCRTFRAVRTTSFKTRPNCTTFIRLYQRCFDDDDNESGWLTADCANEPPPLRTEEEEEIDLWERRGIWNIRWNISIFTVGRAAGRRSPRPFICWEIPLLNMLLTKIMGKIKNWLRLTPPDIWNTRSHVRSLIKETLKVFLARNSTVWQVLKYPGLSLVKVWVCVEVNCIRYLLNPLVMVQTFPLGALPYFVMFHKLPRTFRAVRGHDWHLRGRKMTKGRRSSRRRRRARFDGRDYYTHFTSIERAGKGI